MKEKNSHTDISNIDLFLFALYRLEGVGRYVDVEDVFNEMWKLSPSRFTWRKYPYPNYKATSQAINDMVKKGQSDLVLGEGYQRQLSARGVEYVMERMTIFQGIVEGTERSTSERRPSQKLAIEAARSPVVKRFLNGRNIVFERGEISILLKCAPDAPRNVWRERLETLKAAARDAHREELLQFLRLLEEEEAGWFTAGGHR